MQSGPDAQPDHTPLAPQGWGALFSGSNAVPALVLSGGVTLYAVNMYIATTVMPSVVAEIGGLGLYAWTMSLFVLGSILGAALAANLLRLWGARLAYIVAAGIFAGGTVICATAFDMGMMLAGRMVQGLGGGLFYALAYALIRQVLSEAVWGKAIALISAVFGVSTLIGPAIGGIFADLGAWRLAFWALVPFALLFALVAAFAFPARTPKDSQRQPLPLLQLALLSGAVIAVSAGSLSPHPIWALAGLVLALGLIAFIALCDQHAPTRLLPKGSFRLSMPLGALYLLIALLMLGMQPEIYVPYVLQILHEQSPLWAGYLAALMSMGWTAGSLLSARWQERHNGALIVTGPALVTIGLVLLAGFLPTPSQGSWLRLAPICIGLILIGVGIGMAWPGIVTRIYRNAPADEQDLATSGMTTVQLFAIAFGTALAGMIANIAGISPSGQQTGASAAAFWLCAVLAIAPALGVLAARRVLRLT